MVDSRLEALCRSIRDTLVNHRQELLPLLKPIWRKKNTEDNPLYGFCYLAAEAFYFLGGGKEAGLKPVVLKLPGGGTHWWVVDAYNRVYDPTKEQFEEPVPYEKGRPCGFPTPRRDGSQKPSKRTQKVISLVKLKDKVDK